MPPIMSSGPKVGSISITISSPASCGRQHTPVDNCWSKATLAYGVDDYDLSRIGACRACIRPVGMPFHLLLALGDLRQRKARFVAERCREGARCPGASYRTVQGRAHASEGTVRLPGR